MLVFLFYASSLIATIGMGALAYGYRASLFSQDKATRWFSLSMVMISGGFFLRRSFWDFIFPFINDSFNPRPTSIVFNLIAIAGVYCGLRARLNLIPEEERQGWRWWNSWQHPHVLQMRMRPRPLRPDEERDSW